MAYTSEIEKLERRMQENPQGRFFASLADAYRKDGQVARALEVLNTGLQIHPDYVSARVVLGRCLLDQGDDAGAEAAFTRVTELDGESVIALKALADIAERRGDLGTSAKWARQLLTVDPGSSEARDQLARVEQGAPPAPAPVEIPVALQGLGLGAEDPPAVEPEPVLEVVPEPPAPPRRDSIRFEPARDTAARTLEIPTVEPAAPGPEIPVLRLSGMEPTVAEDATAPAAPLAGLESAAPAEPPAIDPLPTLEPPPPALPDPAPPLAGLEASALAATPEPDGGAMAGLETTHFGETLEAEPAGSDEVERETEIEIAGAASNEFQEPDASADLSPAGESSEYQTPSAAELLGTPTSRLSGISPVTDDTFGADDPPTGLAEPEPVVTEAMAELYVRQGHVAAALGVYRELLARAPGDPHLRARVQELEGSGSPSSGGGWLASETGGVSVQGWLRRVMTAHLPEVALPSGGGAVAEPAPEEETPDAGAPPSAPAAGAPTRPAADSPSLGSIFGEEPSAGPAQGPGSGSFDDFFGGAPPGAAEAPAAAPARSIRRAQPDDADLGQFQDWLKNLKK